MKDDIYRVVMVYADSDHPLADKVEDEEALFVIKGDYWWLAEDFFYRNSMKAFKEV